MSHLSHFKNIACNIRLPLIICSLSLFKVNSMTKENGYGWIITQDNIDGGEAVGTYGPRNTAFTPEELKKGTRFRLLDGDEEVYFYGKAIGTGDMDQTEEHLFGPLDDFGAGYGCMDVQFWNGTEYESI